MRQRTVILRLWHDAVGALNVQVSDPLSELHARFASAEELWAALQAWSNTAAHSQIPPSPPPGEGPAEAETQ